MYNLCYTFICSKDRESSFVVCILGKVVELEINRFFSVKLLRFRVKKYQFLWNFYRKKCHTKVYF